MAQLTYDPTPADQPEFSEEEQDSLRVGEQLAEQQNQMLAGKFENAEQLEKLISNFNKSWAKVSKKLSPKQRKYRKRILTTWRRR